MRKHITADGKPLPVLRNPTMAAAILHSQTPRSVGRLGGEGRIPPDCPYAILRSPHEKPTCFGSARAMAKRLHRDRGDAPLQIVNCTLYLPNEPGGRPMAKIWSLHEGSAHRFLGYCWLGHVQSPKDLLCGALEAARPVVFEAAA